MRKVETYTTAAGHDRFKVRFREGTGRSAPTSSLTFVTHKQADRFARELDVLGWREAVARAESRAGKSDTLTVEAYANRHVETITGITEGTRTTYRRIVTKTWVPAIGHLAVEDVTRHDIMAVIRALSEAGKSDKTIANEHGVVAAIFNAAVIDGHIPASPCRGVRLPRNTEHESAEMQILDVDEFEVLLSEIPEHYEPLITTLVGTGIRWGEAEALEVGDLALNIQHPIMRVRRAAKWNSGKARREVGPTKTKRGRRDIELAPEVVEVLRPLVVGKREKDRVFTAAQGGELRHRTFWSDVWRPTLFRASQCAEHRVDGCSCGTAHARRCKHHESPPPPCRCPGTLYKPMRIHDLRHTAASWMLAAGIPIHVVQRILGHESIKTTVDTYGHLMPEGRRAAAAAMSSILGRNQRAIES